MHEDVIRDVPSMPLTVSSALLDWSATKKMPSIFSKAASVSLTPSRRILATVIGACKGANGENRRNLVRRARVK